MQTCQKGADMKIKTQEMAGGEQNNDDIGLVNASIIQQQTFTMYV